MLIQIQALQVPKFWEVIKFAAVNSDDIKDDVLRIYTIELLQDLLSNKKICYIAQEGDKILFVVIIEFKINPLKDMKYVYFTNLYSFVPQDMEIWKNVFLDLYTIAKENDCKAIIGESSSNKVAEINKFVGAKCIAQKYAYYL